MLRRWFGRKPGEARALKAYGAIVAASRQKAFYADLGVADSLEGRFELLVLHGSLATRRLSAGGEAARALSQEVFDLMFSDLDQSLRELGVGDLAVPKRMRRMAEAFYGRAKAYGVALGEDAPEGALEAVIARNVFGGEGAAPGPRSVAALARYCRAAAARLAELPEAALLEGRLVFAEAAEFAPAEEGPVKTEAAPLARPVRPSEVREPRELVIVADEGERGRIAARLGLEGVDRLEARLTLRPWRRHGLRVTGELAASVGQICTVTLEPMSSEIRTEVDERFYPEDEAGRHRREDVIDPEATDDFEPFSGDTVDVGALVVECLALAIDPYPRRPGAVFAGGAGGAADDRPPSPFAALAGRIGGTDSGEGGDDDR